MFTTVLKLASASVWSVVTQKHKYKHKQENVIIFHF